MVGLGLADAIQHLRKELGRAREEGEGEELQFKLGPIELELEMVLQASAGVEAGFKWVVVSVGGKASGGTSAKHRIKLTLNPIVENEESVKVGQASLRPK